MGISAHVLLFSHMFDWCACWCEVDGGVSGVVGALLLMWGPACHLGTRLPSGGLACHRVATEFWLVCMQEPTTLIELAEMVGRLAVKRVIYILAVRSTRKPAGSPQKLNTSWQHTEVEDGWQLTGLQ